MPRFARRRGLGVVGLAGRWLPAVASGALVLVSAAGAAAPVITEFSVGITDGAAPGGIVAGPDGNLWFTEIDGGRIGRITPAGVVTEYRLGAVVQAHEGSEEITTGPDSNLWFTEYGANRIGKITPAGVVTEYSAGLTAKAHPFGIAAGPDGNLWFTEYGANRIGKITPAGVVIEYSAGITAGSFPNRIAVGPDGNLWFTEIGGDRIGKITPAGAVTEYRAGITAGSAPNGIAAGPDGNTWFTEYGANRIGKITPAGVVTEYGYRSTTAYRERVGGGIAAGPDGNLWFTESRDDKIGRITPAGVVTEYGAGITDPRGIAPGPDGNMWFTESGVDRIGRLSLPRVSVTVTIWGEGRVTGGGISCAGRCKATIPLGATLTLRASPIRGYRFAGWSGACKGIRACTLHPRSAVSLTATFRKRTTTSGKGSRLHLVPYSAPPLRY